MFAIAYTGWYPDFLARQNKTQPAAPATIARAKRTPKAVAAPLSVLAVPNINISKIINANTYALHKSTLVRHW